MTALLRAELLKLRTTRTFLALAGVAVGTSLLIAVLVAPAHRADAGQSVLTDVFTPDTSGLFIVILAVVGITGEWRHRTITSSLLAAPDRLRFLAAKTLAFAAAGLVLSLLISLTVAVVGTTILSSRDLPLPAPASWPARSLATPSWRPLLGAFGVALGALVRNQLAAVVGVLIARRSWSSRSSWRSRPTSAGSRPFGALPVAAAGLPAENAGIAEDVDLLSVPLAVLAMVAWIAIAFAASALLLQTRDLNERRRGTARVRPV